MGMRGRRESRDAARRKSAAGQDAKGPAAKKMIRPAELTGSL
jgi:hypothetical protein